MATTARGFDGKYGPNSTIPSPNEIAASIGLRPLRQAPNWVWKIAWRGHGRLLPLLHINDQAKPKDADQSLKVLWNKAIVSIDKSSPGYDQEWTYDLLPRPSRTLLRIARPFLPRLHHANIEIRTVYLDQIIQQEIETYHNNENKHIRLVILGGGYDPRGARLLTENKVQQAFELDLAQVLAAKRQMLERLKMRRTKRGQSFRSPQLVAVDLNNHTALVQLLEELVQSPKNDDSQHDAASWHTIFVSEGVLIYIDDPNEVLRLCANAINDDKKGRTASLCFADRLAEVPGGDEVAGGLAFSQAGWDLIEWKPKPGLARHMGLARAKGE